MFSSPRGQQMYEYLAWYYGNSRIMQAVLDSQGVEIGDARTALEESLKQFYVETAGDWGISRWEKELALNPPANASLELRRALVKAKLLRPQIITPKVLESIANCFVPGNTAKITDRVAPYTFRLTLSNLAPWTNEMLDAVEEAKPAHLAYGVEVLIQQPGSDDPADGPADPIKNQLIITVGLAQTESGIVDVGPEYPRSSPLSIVWGAAINSGGIFTQSMALITVSAAAVSVGVLAYECGIMTTKMKGDS